MGRDKRGCERGKCREEGCDCTEYECPTEAGHSCAYCGHVPAAHANLGPAKSAVVTSSSVPAQPPEPVVQQPPPVIAGIVAATARYPPPAAVGTPPVATAPAAPAAPSAPAAPAAPADWAPGTLDTLCEMLPKLPRQTIEADMMAHVPKGDFDGLVRKLQEKNAGRCSMKTSVPDPETLKAIQEAMIPEFDCILCLDTFKVTHMYTVDCESAHRFCFECVGRYVELMIKDALPIICPAPNKSCKHELGEAEVMQIIKNTSVPLDPGLAKKYSEQMLLRGIKSIPGVIACPTPGCANWVVPYDTKKCELCVCDACRAQFCSLCRKLFHYNCGCDEIVGLTGAWIRWVTQGRARYTRNKSKLDALKARKAASDDMKRKYEELLADEKYKAEHGRLCPNCKRVIIRESGCDSMVCGRDYHGGNVQDGCGSHFNWSKAKPYRPASYKEPKGKTVEVPDDVRDYVHEGVQCSNCRGELRGIRVCCIHCRDYSLCERCEIDAIDAHPKDHIFRVMMKPGHSDTEEIQDPDAPEEKGKSWWQSVWKW